MTKLVRLALLALVTTAGFGAIELLRALAPAMPGELRGFVAACLAIAAGAVVIDRVTA